MVQRFQIDRGLGDPRSRALTRTLRERLLQGEDGSSVTLELLVQVAMLAEKAYRRGVQQGLRRSGPNCGSWREGFPGDVSPPLEAALSNVKEVDAEHCLIRAQMECPFDWELGRLLFRANELVRAENPGALALKRVRRR